MSTVANPTGSLYFLVVRNDGPAGGEFTANMKSPQWKTLEAAGHRVKDFTFTDSKAFVTLPAGTVLPCVVTLRVSADWKAFAQVAGPVALPSGDAILDLPKAVK